MKVTVYNQEGKKVGTTLLPKEIFEVKVNPDLVWQVVTSQIARRRKTIAHTKDRGEVSGGGRKPWRQKGTGRARHGSIRSPIWRGGGITFGPTKDKVFKKRIPEKMQRLALFMTLSAKAKNNLILILDKLEIEKPKTKEMSKIISNLKSKIKEFKEGRCFIVLPKYDKKFVLAARNIPQVKVMEARNLNPLDLLSLKYLMMPKESIKSIQETFLKK
jgi:large subunit ribosomal protein L4